MVREYRPEGKQTSARRSHSMHKIWAVGIGGASRKIMRTPLTIVWLVAWLQCPSFTEGGLNLYMDSVETYRLLGKCEFFDRKVGRVMSLDDRHVQIVPFSRVSLLQSPGVADL